MKKEFTTKIKNFLEARSKKFWIISAGVFILILAAVIVLSLLNRGPMGFGMQTSSVTSGSIIETMDTYGILEARPSVTLTWQSDGVVDDFDLEVGDVVEAGQELMELNPTSQSTEILQAYSDLLEAQYELDLLTTTDSDYQEVLADLVYQEKMLINKHADKLAWNYGQSSEDRVDAVWDNYYAARAEVWELEDAYEEVKDLEEDDPIRVEALEALEAGELKRNSLLRALNQIIGIEFDIAVETDFIEYDQQVATVAEAWVSYETYVDDSEEISAAQAEVNSLQNLVNEAKIIPSASGTVTSISAVPGQVVSAGDEAVRVDNMDNLVIDVSISQSEINKIQVGQEAVISFDAVYKKEYSGFVQSIEEEGTANSNGVVVFNVEIKVEDVDEDVKPGFTAVVNIIVNESEEALLVPNQAITTQEDGTNVVTVIGDGGSMEMISVEVGAESDAYTQVISDEISEGDTVAILTNSDSTNGDSNMRGTGMGGGLFGGILGGGGGPR